MKKTCAALLAIALSPAHAWIVDPTSPARVDFTLDSSFTQPGVLVSYTVSFGTDDLMAAGEGLEISTYSSTGTLLGQAAYTAGSSLIGCACWDEWLSPAIDGSHFYALLRSASGSFDVQEIVALVYDGQPTETSGSLGTMTRDVGVIHAAPEPSMLGLVALGLLAALRRRTQ